MKKNVHKIVGQFAAALLASICLTGCATVRLSQVRPVPEKPTQVLVKLNSRSVMSARLQSIVEKQLRQKGIQPVFASADAPVLTGQIFQLDPGSQLERYLFSFGAGKGTLRSRWVLTDNDDKQLGSCRIDGSVSFGILGGSFNTVLKKAGDRVSDFLTETK